MDSGMCEKPVEVVEKLWGRELQIVTFRTDMVNGYSGKILEVDGNGKCCSVHYHKRKVETFYELVGNLRIQLWKFKTGCFGEDSLDAIELTSDSVLRVGHALTIYPYIPHRFWSVCGQCRFVEFSTPDSPDDSYRIIPSGLVE
jgi:D-lyxose ketol-isomerase